jgi:hypothetical protein
MLRKLLLIIVMVTAFATVRSQSPFIVDNFGIPQPFSLNEPYRSEIQPENLAPNYETGSYNNDSLFWVYNDDSDLDKLRRIIKAGTCIDSTNYSFKDEAKHFDLGHGNLWLYKITSPTSKGISVYLEDFKLPKGASLSTYCINQTGAFIEKPKTYTTKNYDRFLGSLHVDGQEMYIEYYEPKTETSQIDFAIKKICYFFSDGRFINIPDPSKKKEDEMNLKSGAFGTSLFGYCGNKIPCSDTKDWVKESMSVVYSRIELDDQSYVPGTGFFINKANGYSFSDYPYIITAGHFFAPNNVDLRNSIVEKRVYVNYQDQSCDEMYERQGSMVGGFTIEAIGNSFNKGGQGDYIGNEDYALLKSDQLVQQLAVHNVLYAGWDRSFNYEGNSGYTYIGHPNSDVKSLNTYSGYGEEDVDGNYFKIYNSTGINEEGFSGSPVFWGDPSLGNVKAVGWAVQTGIGSFTCGDENQVTHCGMFSDLFWNTDIQNSLNPDMKYSESSSQPTTEALPDHCTNCMQDGDETGVDCGGSCQPCGMADELVINDKADIFDRSGQSEINARFALLVDGGAGQLEFADNDYVLTSGETISLKSFKVSTGATFKAQVVPSQQYEPFQGCQPACISMPHRFYTNDGGINIFYPALFSYVTEYDINIVDEDGDQLYYDENIPVYENGEVVLWDGEGTKPLVTYFVSLWVTDCFGEEKLYKSYVSYAKSAFVDVALTNNEAYNINDEVLFYPNPADNVLKIYVNKSLSRESYNVSVFDITGKKIKETTMGGTQNNLDISNMHPGSYILRMSTKEKTFTKRFLKK